MKRPKIRNSQNFTHAKITRSTVISALFQSASCFKKTSLGIIEPSNFALALNNLPLHELENTYLNPLRAEMYLDIYIDILKLISEKMCLKTGQIFFYAPLETRSAMHEKMINE